MRTRSRNSSDKAFRRARALRRKMSVSEKWLWNALRKEQLGFKFRRQVAVGDYFLDFYCPEASLCVEVDGEHHKVRRAYDRQRDEFLRERGIEVLRMPSLDLFDVDTPEFERWLRLIEEVCWARACGLRKPVDPTP